MRLKILLTTVLAVCCAAALIVSCTKDLDCDTCPCPACPRIDELIPNDGGVGDTIALRGANFSLDASKNEVEFDGVPALVVGPQKDDTLYVIVPLGVSTGPVTIKVDELASEMIPDHVFPVFTVLGAATYVLAGTVSEEGRNDIDGIPGVGRIDSITSMVSDGQGNLIFMDASTPIGFNSMAKLRYTGLNEPYILDSYDCEWTYNTSIFRPRDPAPNVTVDPVSGFVYTIQVNDSTDTHLKSLITLGCGEGEVSTIPISSSDTVKWGESMVAFHNDSGSDWLYFFDSYQVPFNPLQAFQLRRVPVGGGDPTRVGNPGPFRATVDFLHLTDMEIASDGTVFVSATCEDTDQSMIFRRLSDEPFFRRILYVRGPTGINWIAGIAINDNDLDHPYFSLGTEVRRVETLGDDFEEYGTSSVVAGSTQAGYYAGAGPLTTARFRRIGDIDLIGNKLYVVDQGNHVIRGMELPN